MISGVRTTGMTGKTQEAEETAGVTITPGRSYGFFTDTTLCIGCKACEVACKEWNMLPADGPGWTGRSYDNTHELSAKTWRHVKFIEQFDAGAEARRGSGVSHGNGVQDGIHSPHESESGGAQLPPLAIDGQPLDLRGKVPTLSPATNIYEAASEIPPPEGWADPGNRWLMMSDVCKHCVHAPCMEACPTGAIIRTEFDTVYVQQDVCNGCGYCVPACPFAVIEVDKEWDGKAHKCTLCYDRLKDGLEPACSKACPTDSIQFGPVDELLERAEVRVADLRARGIPAYLYGSNGRLEDRCDTTALSGLNAFFLLIDEPEVYNLPPAPIRPSTNTGIGVLGGALGALALTGAIWFTLAREGEE